MRVSERPSNRGAQGLTGFGAIRHSRVQRVHTKRLIGNRSVAHVGNGQIAEAGIAFLTDVGGQNLVPPVEIADFHGLVGKILQGATADEAIALARGETPPEAQLQILVGFLEDDRGAVGVLVEVAAGGDTPARIAATVPRGTSDHRV
jgi:hypothetical protein